MSVPRHEPAPELREQLRRLVAVYTISHVLDQLGIIAGEMASRAEESFITEPMAAKLREVSSIAGSLAHETWTGMDP